MKDFRGYYFITILFCVVWILFNQQALAFPPDTGDGLMHFFIAQASWSDGVYFLDHWGKPLFTLLASPFAQGPYWGIVLFNTLVFLATCLVARKIFQRLKVAEFLQVLFPFFLVLTHLYADTILAGLTEPLFSLFLLLASWFLLDKRYILFAIAIGCMPFLRSEGQLAVILALPILFYFQQWKILPYLALPFLFYAFAGWIALGDFWWYFNDSPYHLDNAIYGKGTFSHYFVSYKNYIGNHGLVVFLLALPILFTKLWKKTFDAPFFFVLYLSYGVFFGVLFSHAYFWANGLNGSMGLTRIATQGMPSFLLVNIVLVHHYQLVTKVKQWASPVLIVACGSYLVFSPYNQKVLSPLDEAYAKLIEQFEDETFYTKKTKHYYHPIFAYLNGFNPKMSTRESSFFHGNHFEKQIAHFRFGELIFWDSHFGPQEMNLPYNNLQNHPNFIEIARYLDKADRDSLQVSVFQYVPEEYKRKHTIDSRVSELFNPRTIDSNDEFVDVFKWTKSDKNYSFLIDWKAPESVVLVFSDKTAENYYPVHGTNDYTEIVLAPRVGLDYSIYIWNPKKEKFKVELRKAQKRYTVFPKPYL